MTGPAMAMTAPAAAVKARVNELINNPRRAYTEFDRPKLEACTEKMLIVLQVQPLGPLPCGCVRDFCIHLQESYSKPWPARLLEENMQYTVLRKNILLSPDEWELLDRRVVQSSVDVMNAIADLRALGLTTNLGGLGVLMWQYEQVCTFLVQKGGFSRAAPCLFASSLCRNSHRLKQLIAAHARSFNNSAPQPSSSSVWRC